MTLSRSVPSRVLHTTPHSPRMASWCSGDQTGVPSFSSAVNDSKRSPPQTIMTLAPC